MTAPTLRARWLAAMRASTTRAIGRECDYAMSEGDVDKFDPLGLLALLEGEDVLNDADWFFVAMPFADGAYIKRSSAEHLAAMANFPPAKLYDLALLNDAGVSWADMADYVEAQR